MRAESELCLVGLVLRGSGIVFVSITHTGATSLELTNTGSLYCCCGVLVGTVGNTGLLVYPLSYGVSLCTM